MDKIRIFNEMRILCKNDQVEIRVSESMDGPIDISIKEYFPRLVRIGLENKDGTTYEFYQDIKEPRP